jgi:zinc transport system substrate-binding protein
MKHQFLNLLILFLASTAFAKPSVTVGIPPQAHIVKEIAAETVHVSVLLKSGASPATYSPSISQLNKLGTADVYFLMGLPFENRVIGKIEKMLPGLHIVDTRSGITFRYFNHAEIHHHGDDSHDKGAVADPHVWMNTQNLEIMAKNILQELIRISPEHENLYLENFKNYQNKLHSIQTQLEEITASHKGTYIAVYHPAFGYLFEPFGIHQIIIEQMGKEPSASDLVNLSEEMVTHGVKTLIAQTQFSDKSAKILSSQLHIKLLIENQLEENAEENLLSIIKRAFKQEN